MDVLVVTVVHHPQDARILHRQIAALLGAGHGVTYVAPWSATGSTPPAGITAIDVPRAVGRGRLPAAVAARRHMRRLAGRVDLLLLHDPELLVAVAGLHRPPTVWDVHEDTAATLADKPYLPPPVRPVVRGVVRLLERLAERRMHLILAEEQYRPLFRSAHPVVPNETLVPRTVRPPGDSRVVYLGRISLGRGVHELLELARQLPRGVTLELIGPCDPDVEGELLTAQRSGRLVWRGFVPNDAALQLLDGALAGLSLLRDEANYRHSRPTKVVEYMSRGVPVITTPNPIAAAIVQEHRCGMVVPYRAPEEVAAAVESLRSDSAKRLAMGQRGHGAALDAYDWAATGRRFVRQLEVWAQR